MRPRHLDAMLAALALLASATANGYGTDPRDGTGPERAAGDCLQCHRIEGHAAEHGALVLGARTSDLCFACHDL